MAIPLNLTAPILFFGTTYVIDRRDIGDYDNNTGEYIRSPLGNVNRTMTVQPTRGEEHMMLVEAGHTEGGVAAWSDGDLIQGDVFTWNGRQWVVVILLDRHHDGLYHKALCSLYRERGSNTP